MLKKLVYMFIAIVLISTTPAIAQDELSSEEKEFMIELIDESSIICEDSLDFDACVSDQVASALGIGMVFEQMMDLPNSDPGKEISTSIMVACLSINTTDDNLTDYVSARICIETKLDQILEKMDELIINEQKKSGV
jgi:hypothetical protein